MKTYLIILSLLFSNICFCQNVYFLGNYNWIYKINENNTISPFIEISTGLILNDFALSPNNEFYGVNSNKIYRINSNGTMDQMVVLPEGSYNNLVCSNNNELYTLNNINYNLYKYNITNNVLELVAFIGLETPGDLTFYKGNLIFPVIQSAGKKIFGYNLQTHTLSTIFCLDDNIGWQFFGITNIHNSCESETIYITAADQLFELDFDQHSMTNLGINLQGVCSGLTSTTEFLSSVCTNPLQNIICNLGLNDFSQERNLVILSPNPVEDLLKIETKEAVDAIEFYSINGKFIKKIDNPKNPISLKDFASGMYFVRVYIQDKIVSEKIIRK